MISVRRGGLGQERDDQSYRAFGFFALVLGDMLKAAASHVGCALFLLWPNHGATLCL